MFFELYWQYFVAGLVIYLCSKVGRKYFASNNDDEKVKAKTFSTGRPQKNTNVGDDFKTPDQIADDEDSEDEFSEDGPSPALPNNLQHIPLNFHKRPPHEIIQRSQDFYQLMNKRRTVRRFSAEPIPHEVIQNIVKTAGTAPSGAHTEPWTYVIVTSDDVKRRIREIVEDEEEINYKKRMGKVWTTDLKPFKTNWIKEYLTEAPCLILVFKQMYSFREDGKKKLHYYNEQSVAIAAGFLLAAIHYAGLASLTSTPLNCGPALRTLLERPSSEKLTLLFPVGYPAEDCLVPDLSRKALEEIMVEF